MGQAQKCGEIKPVNGIHYVVKFICDFRMVGDFLLIAMCSPKTNLNHHDIANILLNI